MRIVLAGDSHLARVRRGVQRIGQDVDNRAVGGSTADEVGRQLSRRRGLRHVDVVVVSIGTNDALRGRPVTEFEADLGMVVELVGVRRLVLMSPPLTSPHADRATELVAAAGGAVVDTRRLLAPLGVRGLAEDGIHLTGAAYDVVLPAIATACARDT